MDPDLTVLFTMLKSPLNLAHVEDRKSEKYLKQDETNYEAAIECHQRAHAHLRTVQMNIPSKDLHRMNDANKAVIDSVYAQMEHHLMQQSILLHRQKRAITELKRQPYVASIRERTTELALVDALKHKEKLQKQLSQQDSLLESLKERLSHEEILDNLANETEIPGSQSLGTKKPKSPKDTLEELKNVNDEFKQLIDELVNENVTLKAQLELLRSSLPPDCSVMSERTGLTDVTTSVNSVDNPIYSLPKALELEPLENPDFDIPDDALKFDDEDSFNF